MVLQQFGGVNGIAFYASSIFISAGKWRPNYEYFVQSMGYKKEWEKMNARISDCMTGFSGSIGMIAMVVIQVIDS